MGACKKGVQRCVDGAFETTCTGQVLPKDETCNGIDDDCDGTVDDGVGETYYPDGDGDGFGAGEPLVACAQPAGASTNSTDCDDARATVNPSAVEQCSSSAVDENCNGTVNEGCGCTSPGATIPCCSGRGTQTCQASDGGAAYSVCSVAPAAELCNGLDDDCDGQIDESISFISADGGTVSLPDGGVIAADGTCAAGVGACRRTATATCAASVASCVALPGDGGTEVCNGQDDDCDGQIDEGTQMACFGDPDNDGVASGTSEQKCADSTRPTFGNCPLGFVATQPAVADCAPTDPAAWRTVSTRADGDADTYCSGTATNECIGASPATGRRLDTTCAATDDCDDASASTYRTASVRTDADGDAFCVGTAANECIGAAAPAGKRLESACSAAGDDCDDASASTAGTRVSCYPDPDNDGVASGSLELKCPDSTRPTFGNCPLGFVATEPAAADCAPTDPSAYRIVSTRADGDADTYCTGTATNECIGANAPAGRRVATSCAATADCNDASATGYQTASVRTDADGDTFCVGAASNQCIGATPASGTRLASSCSAVGDDCNDSNATTGATRVACYPDEDNDGVASASTTTQLCVDTSRPTFGNCPLGYVATAPTAFDCAPSDATKYRTAVTRADADNDTYCVGVQTNECIGASPPTGRRLLTACSGTDDCNDASSFVYQLASVRTDADGDSYCTGAATNACIGAGPAAGTRLASSCNASISDCNDGNGSLYRLATLRTDADSDAFCVNPAYQQCIGASVPAGTKEATACQGEDCKDTNGSATSSCSFVGYFTNTARKECGFSWGATETKNVTVSLFCPAGFSLTSTQASAPSGDSGGSCAPVNPTQLLMGCGSLVFGSFTCRIEGTCVAN